MTCLGMVEAPNDRRKLAQKGILLARTLVKTDSGAIPVRVYNPTGSQRAKRQMAGNPDGSSSAPKRSEAVSSRQRGLLAELPVGRQHREIRRH